jgi:hypothetical protein
MTIDSGNRNVEKLPERPAWMKRVALESGENSIVQFFDQSHLVCGIS